MNHFHTIATCVTAALTSFATYSHAAVIPWVITELNQANEVGTPNLEVPDATGSASGTIEMTGEDEFTLSWSVEWSNLSASASGAHFHGPAETDENAGVQVNFGALSGLTSPSEGSTTISTAQADDLLAGLYYINIHTSNNTSGEIRGQVTIIPEPAAFSLFTCGALAMLPRRRQLK